MFVLPKGTLVKFRGLPFELLEDVATNGSEENYKLALSHETTSGFNPNQAADLDPARQTKSASS